MSFLKSAAVATIMILGLSGGAAYAGHSVHDYEHHRDHAACRGQHHRNKNCRIHGHPSSSHYYYHHNRHGHHGMMLD